MLPRVIALSGDSFLSFLLILEKRSHIHPSP